MTGAARCEGSASALAGFYCMYGQRYGSDRGRGKHGKADRRGYMYEWRALAAQISRVQDYGSTTGYERVHTKACEKHGLSHSLIVRFIVKTQDHSQGDKGSGRKTAISGHMWSGGLAREGCFGPLGVRRKRALAAPVRRVGEVSVDVRACGLSRSG